MKVENSLKNRKIKKNGSLPFNKDENNFYGM